ncbi:TCP-1/cpn60 chaperonin family protein [Perilla frutescens var. frutescens]|nr:TCP-1/cpn60 chaperonin family protein [Perilla frutescens var. frutescens]
MHGKEKEENLQPQELENSLVKSASTSLNSKVAAQYSTLLTPLNVDVVLSAVDPEIVDLKNIKIVKKLGGVVGYTESVNRLVLDKKVNHAASGQTRVENAKNRALWSLAIHRRMRF